jgi:chemosensory pili system protein ChpC
MLPFLDFLNGFNMSTNNTSIRCLLIPIGKEQLLLPSALVAEITTYKKPEPRGDNQPDWLLGTLHWRHQHIPLLSVEELLTLSKVASVDKYRNVILYGLENLQTLPFYALRITDVPRPLIVTADNLINNPRQQMRRGLAYNVKIQNTDEMAWLADLTYLENVLSQLSVVNY